jgi:hypothetical protein
MIGMKVLIAGSTHFDGSDTVRNKFISTCEELGKALASNGHTIIAGSVSPSTADFYVVKGATTISENSPHKVILYRAEGGQFPYKNKYVNFPKIEFVEAPREQGAWAAGYPGPINEADVVILIGGNHGTERVGFSALAFHKPVVPIASFGGAARKY